MWWLLFQAQPEIKWCLQMVSLEVAAATTAMVAAIVKIQQVVVAVTAWHSLWTTLDLWLILSSSGRIRIPC